LTKAIQALFAKPYLLNEGNPLRRGDPPAWLRGWVEYYFRISNATWTSCSSPRYYVVHVCSIIMVSSHGNEMIAMEAWITI